MAPITIDGTEISSITIDGTNVKEVTIDGNVAWTAIPDKDDLYLRTTVKEISASNGDSISSVPDTTGNNSDLTGDGVYRTNAINGNDVLEYTTGDSTEDGHQVSLSSTVSPPYLISWVGNWVDVQAGSSAVGFFGISSNDPNGSIADEEAQGSGQFVMFDGAGNEGRHQITTDNPYIWTLEASNSDEFNLYVDGTAEITFSSSGSAPVFDVLAQGRRWNNLATECEIPEVLAYDYSSASDMSRSEIESYLDTVYGPIL